MFESCVEIRGHFSDYVDGVCSRDAFRSVRYHLEHCASCREELEQWEAMRVDLRALPRKRASWEADLQVRVRLSQEIHCNVLGRMLVRLENWVRPVLLPASAGVLLTAALCLSVIVSWQAPPVGSAPDVPLELSTPPRLQRLAPLDFNTGDQPVVLVTRVDAGGRALDYRVLSGPSSPELTRHLDRLMYFSVFHPATMFGQPTGGQVVLSLRRITVRG
ncbi:MAG TPA: zf-HC2 domain-containing protein [Terriglobia bacterium]|nr:zf-HC2 domain-containing protein [Terriglobia bacterium]